MKPCRYCGRENPKEAAHCSGCATPFDDVVVFAPESDAAPVASVKSRRLADAFIIAPAVVSALVTVITLLVLPAVFGGIHHPKSFETFFAIVFYCSHFPAAYCLLALLIIIYRPHPGWDKRKEIKILALSLLPLAATAALNCWIRYSISQWRSIG